MSRIDLITRLPTCLSCSVLCEWIRLKSFARLDSAYCNQKERSLFLELMRCRECVSGDEVYTSTPRLLEWLLVRELQISKMIVDFAHVRLAKYLSQNATAFHELGLHWEVLKLVPDLQFTNLIALTCPLRLSSCAILANFPKLRKLTVTLRSDSDEDIAIQSGLLPELVYLDVRCLKRYKQLPGGSILSVVRTARSLKHLIQEHTISHTEWMSIAKCCPQLLTLSVFTKDLPDVTIGEFCRLCPHITKLLICLNSSITDASLPDITQRLHYLQSLMMYHCPQLTDLSLVHIASHCSAFHTVSWMNYSLMILSTLVELQQKLKQNLLVGDLDSVFSWVKVHYGIC